MVADGSALPPVSPNGYAGMTDAEVESAIRHRTGRWYTADDGRDIEFLLGKLDAARAGPPGEPSEGGYVRNCYIKQRTDQAPGGLFFPTHLDGYAIVPVEEYYALVRAIDGRGTATPEDEPTRHCKECGTQLAGSANGINLCIGCWERRRSAGFGGTATP